MWKKLPGRGKQIHPADPAKGQGKDHHEAGGSKKGYWLRHLHDAKKPH